MSFARSLARQSKTESSRVGGLIVPGADQESALRARSAASPLDETRWSSRFNSPVMGTTPAWTSSTSTSGAAPRGSSSESHGISGDRPDAASPNHHAREFSQHRDTALPRDDDASVPVGDPLRGLFQPPQRAFVLAESAASVKVSGRLHRSL